MTKRKSDAGPERGDGEVLGVSPPDPDPRRPWTLATDGLTYRVPPDYAWVEIWRRDWSEPYRTTWADLNPAANVIGLYWRWAEMATGERA